MGLYINPGNENFKEIRNDTYIDKTGMISVLNKTLNTKDRLTCVSRARRFGKSYAAQMLCAYYCYGCDSSFLFDDLNIADDLAYRDYLNKYNVLYLDIARMMSNANSKRINLNSPPYLVTTFSIRQCLLYHKWAWAQIR